LNQRRKSIPGCQRVRHTTTTSTVEANSTKTRNLTSPRSQTRLLPTQADMRANVKHLYFKTHTNPKARPQPSLQTKGHKPHITAHIERRISIVCRQTLARR